jgi:cell wall-associated NlpC family hydrolase
MRSMRQVLAPVALVVLVAAAALRARALGLGTFAGAPETWKVAAAAVRIALDQVGKPYRRGATGPESFDCSGPVRWAYAHAGLALPAPRASSGGRAARSR